MFEDFIPFFLMFGLMVAMLGVWIFMTVRRALMPKESDYYYYEQSQGTYDYSSSEVSAGKGAGPQG